MNRYRGGHSCLLHYYCSNFNSSLGALAPPKFDVGDVKKLKLRLSVERYDGKTERRIDGEYGEWEYEWGGSLVVCRRPSQDR